MIEFRTLGELSLTADDGRTVRSVLAQPKRLALLAYLASPRTPEFVSRGVLVGLFWPESDEERARNALRTSLSFLRRALGPDVLVSRGENDVGLDPARLRCDAAELEAALEAGDDERALDLYGGEYLHGLVVEEALAFERWVEAERRRFRLRTRDAARRLAESALASGAGEQAEIGARRAAALDPWDEATLQLLMRVLAQRGNRAGALEAYERFVDGAREELRLEPSAESEALAAAIRDGQVMASADPAVRAPKAGGDHDSDAPAEDAGPPVSAAPPSAPTGPGAAPPAAGRRSPGSHRWRPWAAAALLVAGAGAILTYRAQSGRSSLAPGSARSIAVLPLENLGPDSTDAYFAGGMTEEIATALTLVPGLAVVSRTSAAVFSGSKLTAPRIADSLGVRYLVEGGASLLGGEAAITVQLIDARADTTMWSHRFAEPARNLPQLEVDVARRIASSLRSKLTRDEEHAILADQTRDPVAYDLYLRAENLPVSGSTSLARAADLLRRAVARDSTFTGAWIGLAQVYESMVGPEWGDSSRVAFAHAARHALTARARAIAVGAPAFYAAHYDTAIAALGEVLAKDPDDPVLLPMQATANADRGNLVEALRLRRRWRDLDPLNPKTWVKVGFTYMLLGLDDEAERALRKAIALDSTSFEAWRYLITLREVEGRFEEGLALEDTLVAVAGDPRELAERGAFHLWMGDVRRGGAMLDSAYRTEPLSDFAPRTPELVRARRLSGDTAGIGALVRRAQSTVHPVWKSILPIRLAAVQGHGAEAARLLREYMSGGGRLLRYVVLDVDFGPVRSDTAFEAAVAQARARLARQRREALRMLAGGSE